MKRQLIISIIGSVVILGFGFIAFKMLTSGKAKESTKQNFEASKYVKIIYTEYLDNQFKIRTNGRLNAKNSIEIFSEVQGIMQKESAKFKVGTKFRKGDILISIDDEETRLQLMTQKSDYLNLLATAMPDIKADFPQSFSKWSEFIQKIDIKKPLPDLPEYDNNKEKFFLAARKILGQYYNIKNMEVRANKYIIKAPFDGTVTSSLIESGTLIRPGQKLGEFSGSDSFELEISLNPSDADLIGVGNKVIAQTGNNSTNGVIIRKSSNIDPSTQSIKVYVQLSNQSLSDGMYLEAEIFGKQIPMSMMVPRKAIINNSFVYVNLDGILEKMQVNILALGSEYAYINGLEPGTNIISDPIVSPTIGMKIEPIK